MSDPRFRDVVAGGHRKAVLFVSGPDRDSSRYRCGHQREQLELRGLTVDVGYYGELDLAALVDHYECFVLYRLPWDDTIAGFVGRARACGRRVLADVDDLVFDQEHAHLVQAVVRLTPRERRRYEDGIRRLRRTLSEVDGVLVSTEPLRAAAAEVNDSVALSYNTVSLVMAAGADATRTAPGRSESDAITVAYLSGTPTHDLDFLEAADAVLWTLESHPNVRFLAAGFVELDDRFDRFADWIERAPYRPWSELPELLARVDVNLAPLERGNPFTEAKSCIKYLEAGLLAVPTVASARPDFARVIDHGRNGLLADSPGEWRDALGVLVESQELRRRLGEEARRDVLLNHTTEARSDETVGALASLARTAPLEAPLAVNWLLPAQDDGSSGRLAGLLAERGHTVRLYGEGASPYVELAPADVTVATDGETARIAAGFPRTLVRTEVGGNREVDELERSLLETAFARVAPSGG